LSDAAVTALRRIAIHGGTVALEQVQLGLSDQRLVSPSQVDATHPLPFRLRDTMTVNAAIRELRRAPTKLKWSLRLVHLGNCI
jgi:hypothetical protein